MSDPLARRDVPAQTRAYLRILYSSRFRQLLERAIGRRRSLAPELGFARTLDFAQLSVEQKARVRNLSHSLRKASHFLAEALNEEQFRALVAAYADHALFWRAKGRSLGENFCLFAYKAFRAAGDPWRAEVARLDGVTFGVAANEGEESPWRTYLGLLHEYERGTGSRSELYRTEVAVLDAQGQLLPDPGVAAGHAFVVQVTSEGAHVRTEVLPC